MQIKAIVLTKSAMNKNGKKGACTTAYDYLENRIVRFVSDNKGSPLPYSVAEHYELFDLISFSVLESCPEGPQQENLYVDVSSLQNHGYYKQAKIPEISSAPENELLTRISGLFENSLRFMDQSGYRIAAVESFSHSLEIVKVSDFRIVRPEENRNSAKCTFTFKGQTYSNFSITDRDYDIRGKDIQEWSIGDAFLAVSIPSVPFEKDGYYYKFIASVFPLTQAKTVRSFPAYSHLSLSSGSYYSASYTGYAPNFRIVGIPEETKGVPEELHSFICVLRNILSRSLTVRPSAFVQQQLSETVGASVQAPDFDAVLRYEFALLSLLGQGTLNISEEAWTFSTREENLLRIAVGDILLWLKNLYQAAGLTFTTPELSFGDGRSALQINNYFQSSLPRNSAGVVILNAEEGDFYHVSSGKSINYRLEQNLPEEKLSALRFLLFNIFGYHDFNQGQLQIITNLLNRKKTLGILPTGGGKSLCYQFAAILQPGVSFSVCPLTSLAEDQKDNLDELGFTRTAYIVGYQDKADKQSILDRFADSRYQLIWISPERFQSEAFRRNLGQLFNISYAIIDEVHCLSEWGHDFRTSYLTLVPTIESLCPDATLVGLTATASQAVLRDLKIEFNIDNYSVRALPSLQRENLTMRVISTDDKTGTLEELLSDEKMVNASTLGIIFTVFADKTGDADARPWSFQLMSDIRKMRPDLKTAKYHARIENKREVQEQFKQDEISILSSTKAFGMGINKDDVRYTIHYSLPWSVEAFYQEAGRAGRGQAKKPADCYIIYTPEDPSIKNVVKRLFDRDATPEEIADIQSKYRRKLNDVGNIFFLWTRNNQGVDKDAGSISAVMDRINAGRVLRDEDGRAYCELKTDWSLKDDQLELALYRLKLLGVVTDWTKEWPNLSRTVFKCFLADDCSLASIRESLFKYIRRYDPGFAKPWNSETTAYQAVLNDTSIPEFRRYVKVLLLWSYDHIIYSRRRMIYNIKEFCEQYKDPISFRKRVDDFLRITDSSVILDGIVDSPENWELWFDIFFEIENNEGTIVRHFLKQESMEALHEAASRYLESFKNVDGLNLVYCLSGALSNRYNIENDSGILTSVFANLRSNYSENKGSLILDHLCAFMDEHRQDFQADALLDFADCIVKEHPERANEFYRQFKNDFSLKILLESATKSIKRILKGAMSR